MHERAKIVAISTSRCPMSATNATAASCRNFRSPRAERTAYCSPILILEIYIYINVAIHTASELRVRIEEIRGTFFRLSGSIPSRNLNCASVFDHPRLMTFRIYVFDKTSLLFWRDVSLLPELSTRHSLSQSSLCALCSLFQVKP